VDGIDPLPHEVTDELEDDDLLSGKPPVNGQPGRLGDDGQQAIAVKDGQVGETWARHKIATPRIFLRRSVTKLGSAS